MHVDEAIRSRRSIKDYEPDFLLSDDELREIFQLVTRSPSSFNLQHWRFVVVRDPARRAELRAASFGQQHVGDANVVVVGARLAAHEDAEKVQQHTPADAREPLVRMIQGYYAGNDAFCRDEAIRSASLAAMTLMLVARSRGLVTCPMIGFDPAKVSAIVGFDEGTIPVMLVTIGKHAGGEPFPTSRLPLDEVVKLETLDGPGLAS